MTLIASWLVVVGLAGLAIVLMLIGPPQRLEADMWGTLVGAMLGASAAMLGAKLERSQSNTDRKAEEDVRRKKVKTLVAAELVNVAAGLLDANRVLRAAVRQIEATRQPVQGYDMTATIRPMPFTDSLGTDLLVLSEPELDVICALRSNLAITQQTMRDIMDEHEHFTLLPATNLRNSVAHDMEILAQAFDALAPTRKLPFEGKPPELVANLLRRLAADGQPPARSRLREEQ